MQIINNIYYYKDIDSIYKNITTIKSKHSNILTHNVSTPLTGKYSIVLKSLLECMYSNVTQYTVNAFLYAVTLVNQKSSDKEKLPELYGHAQYLLISFDRLINSPGKQFLDEFTDSLEDFERLYFKFVTHCTFFTSIHEISKMINLFDNKEVCKEIIKELDKLFKINKLATLHYIISFAKLAQNSHSCLNTYIWNLIYNMYKQNSYRTIVISMLILEIRKVLLDNINEINVKKNIYYSIDVNELYSIIRINDTTIFDSYINNILVYYKNLLTVPSSCDNTFTCTKNLLYNNLDNINTNYNNISIISNKLRVL